MSIAAGRLNRRVTLLAPQTRLSPAHEADVTHRPVWCVWAEVRQQAATEQPADNVAQARVTYTVTLRYRPDVDETWRIEIDGKQWPVSSVVVRGVREELQITAHEVR